MSILVRHAMTERPHTIQSDMNVADAASIMKAQDVGALPVTENGGLVGVVTDRDLVLRVVAERQNPMDVRVGDIATRSTVTVTPDTKLSDARELMQQHRIRRLPVTKGEEIVGILSLGDVAWADASRREVGEALRDISESEETRSMNNDADRGTPRRVVEKRQAG
jgi:CBS domain-containing protein